MHLDKTQTIKYVEIGSLHGGRLNAFNTYFGPNVKSESIDPFYISGNQYLILSFF